MLSIMYLPACSKRLHLDNESYDMIHSPFFKNGYYEQDVVCSWRITSPLRQVLSYTCLANIELFYENIDQILPNRLHRPMHYTIGVTCVYNGHVFYTLFQ